MIYTLAFVFVPFSPFSPGTVEDKDLIPYLYTPAIIIYHYLDMLNHVIIVHLVTCLNARCDVVRGGCGGCQYIGSTLFNDD